MSIGKVKDFFARVREALPGRWFWLLAGLGLIVNGVYLAHQRGDINEASQTLIRLNERFHLEIVNLLHLVVAMPYLLVGGLMCSLAITPEWKKTEEIRVSVPATKSPDWAYYLPRVGVAALLFVFVIFLLAQQKYTPFLAWLWVYILLLLIYLFYRREKGSGKPIDPGISRLDIFWMIGLFLTGLAIGSFALYDIPNIMIPDEGAFWETGRAIATGDLKPDFFAFGVYTFPVASSIFQGLVMRMAGVDLGGWRFASVLAGTLTVFPLYLLAREWFDRRVAILSGILLLASPYYLSFARLGYNNSQALFPVVLSLYLWSLANKRASSLYYWLAGVAAGFGFYTYPAAWLGLTTILILMILFTFARRINFRQGLTSTAVILAAIAATALPRIVYGASSNNPEPLFYKLVETSFVSSFYGSAYYSPAELHPAGSGFLLGTNEIFYAPQIYVELLTRSTVRTLAALIDPYIVTEHFMTTNFAGGFLPAIGLVLGLGLNLRTLKQTRSVLLLVWLGAGLFFLSIIAAFPPRHTHLVAVIPALAMLSAGGIVACIDTFTNQLGRRWDSTLLTWGQLGLIVLICSAVLVSGARQYFVVMPERNPPLFEDIVSWLAWRNEDPMTIVFIGADAERPHRVQYLVDTRMVPHQYISTTPDEFRWKEVPFGSLVFYEQQEKRISTPPLEFSKSATYTDRNEAVIGKAWTNTEVDLQPGLPFSADDRNTPLPNVFLFSGLAIIVFAFLTLHIRLNTERERDEPLFRLTIEIRLRKFVEKIAESRAK